MHIQIYNLKLSEIIQRAPFFYVKLIWRSSFCYDVQYSTCIQMEKSVRYLWMKFSTYVVRLNLLFSSGYTDVLTATNWYNYNTKLKVFAYKVQRGKNATKCSGSYIPGNMHSYYHVLTTYKMYGIWWSSFQGASKNVTDRQIDRHWDRRTWQDNYNMSRKNIVG